MSSVKQTIKDLLKNVASPTKRLLDDNPDLVSALRYFLELKALGDPTAKLTLSWFYREKLRAQFDGPVCYRTVRDYVVDVMRLDPLSGEAL